MSDFSNDDDKTYYPRYDSQTGEPLRPPVTSASQGGAQTEPQAQASSSAASQAQTASAYTAPAYTAAPAKAPSAKSSGLKTFLMGFLGAAVACILAGGVLFGALSADTDSSGSTSGSVNLGSNDSTSITVKGEDANLAEVIAEKTTPSVCCIYVYSKQSGYSLYGFGNSSSDELSQSSLGSGVILSADGYVLTNYHVIEGADALKVSANGTEYDATIVGTDESSDLAVIKLTGASGLTPIAIGDSDNLTIGEWVMTIGSPFGLESSVATGIVSATSRSQIMSSENLNSSGTSIYVNLIQTDAAINPGNSGGALVDSQGKLIGINTLITSYSGNYSGVGFAIPVNYAMEIANTIIEGKTPSHAQLGVTLVSVTSSLAQRYKLPASSGAYISSVISDSSADKAGLEVGDIITKVDDTTVTSASDLMVAVRLKSPGDTITVTYNRDGKEKTATIELGSDATESSTSSSLLHRGSTSNA